jgi:hypothetical protein
MKEFDLLQEELKLLFQFFSLYNSSGLKVGKGVGVGTGVG